MAYRSRRQQELIEEAAFSDGDEPEMDTPDSDGDSEKDLPPSKPIPVSITLNLSNPVEPEKLKSFPAKGTFEPVLNRHQVHMYPNPKNDVSEHALTVCKGHVSPRDNQESEALSHELALMYKKQEFNKTHGNWNLVLSKKKMRQARFMARKETLTQHMVHHDVKQRTESLVDYIVRHHANKKINSTVLCNCSEHQEISQNSSVPSGLTVFLGILTNSQE